MAIRNYTHEGRKQLYEVRYAQPLRDPPDARVNILAANLDDAIATFCGFFKTRLPDPEEIPIRANLTEDDMRSGKRAIIGIERILTPVLNMEESFEARHKFD